MCEESVWSKERVCGGLGDCQVFWCIVILRFDLYISFLFIWFRAGALYGPLAVQPHRHKHTHFIMFATKKFQQSDLCFHCNFSISFCQPWYTEPKPEYLLEATLVYTEYKLQFQQSCSRAFHQSGIRAHIFISVGIHGIPMCNDNTHFFFFQFLNHFNYLVTMKIENCLKKIPWKLKCACSTL